MEDVLEELLQEEIYDENDPMEKEAERIALWVGRHWKRKKNHNYRSIASVVAEAGENMASESTSLLGSREETQTNEKRDGGPLESILQRFSLGG